MTLAAAASSVTAAYALSDLTDQVGSKTLTNNGSATFVSGKFDNAVNLERDSSQYLSHADHADFSMGDIDFMVRAWVNLESKEITGSIVNKGNSSDLEYEIRYALSIDKFQFRICSGTGFANLTPVNADTFGSPSTGVWYLIHAWHDATNNLIGISVNAGTADTVSYTPGCYDSTAGFRIGAYTDFGAEYFDGMIEDVVIMKNRFLDSTERTEDHNGGTGVPFSDWDGGGGSTVGAAQYAYAQQM